MRFFYDYEIIEFLLTNNDIFTDADREELKNLPEEKVEDFHKRFQKNICNLYDFWNVYNLNCFEFGGNGKVIKHPFELSLEIIGRAWEKLNE